jgi:hypothetical protein
MAVPFGVSIVMLILQSYQIHRRDSMAPASRTKPICVIFISLEVKVTYWAHKVARSVIKRIKIRNQGVIGEVFWSQSKMIRKNAGVPA